MNNAGQDPIVWRRPSVAQGAAQETLWNIDSALRCCCVDAARLGGCQWRLSPGTLLGFRMSWGSLGTWKELEVQSLSLRSHFWLFNTRFRRGTNPVNNNLYCRQWEGPSAVNCPSLGTRCSPPAVWGWSCPSGWANSRAVPTRENKCQAAQISPGGAWWSRGKRQMTGWEERKCVRRGSKGWGLKRRDDKRGGEAIITEYEYLDVTLAPHSSSWASLLNVQDRHFITMNKENVAYSSTP